MSDLAGRDLPTLLGLEPETLPSRRSGGLLQAMLREPSVRIGSTLVALALLAATLAPLVSAWLGHGPNEQFRDTALSDMGLPVGPSAAFPLGADDAGRDVLVRTLYGARVSLLVGIPATTLAMLFGTMVGLLSGFVGGRVDRTIAQGIDIALSFPFIVTALCLLSLNHGADGGTLFDPILVVVLTIALFSWTFFARLVRGIVLTLRHAPFVQAAVMTGAGPGRIIAREILPNVLPAVLVYWAVQLPNAIVAEATLSFLGVGIQPPTASWGTMIADAQRTALYQDQPWFLLGPSIALFVTVAGFNTAAAGLRNVLDPYHR